MASENIFVYKLFLSLNISDFSLFFMQKLHPPLDSMTYTLKMPGTLTVPSSGL